MLICVFFFFSSRRRHTRGALVTGVQTCALPIFIKSPVLRDNLDENGGGVSVGTRGEAPRSDRHTPASVFSFGMALLVIVTCQVAPPLEGEMRCPGDISTIIR